MEPSTSLVSAFETSTVFGEVDPVGLETSTCDILEAYYDERNIDLFFCSSYKEGEFEQVWLLAGCSILIGLGLTFAQFSELAKVMTAFDQIRRIMGQAHELDQQQQQQQAHAAAQIGQIGAVGGTAGGGAPGTGTAGVGGTTGAGAGTNQDVEAQLGQLDAQIESLENVEVIDPNNVGGYHVSTFIPLQAGLVLIYFIAKILVISDTSIFKSVSEANKEYDNLSFKKWFNSTNILTVMVLTASSTASQNALKLIRGLIEQEQSEHLTKFSLICCLVFVIDLIGSFIMVCIKYGYLVTWLYMGAVGLLVVLMLLVTICCWAPCIICISILLSNVFQLVFGFLDSAAGGGGGGNTRRSPNDEPTKCQSLLRALAGALSMFIVIYFMIVLMLLFSWLFLEGPIEEAIFIVDKGNQLAIFWCLVTATIYGFLVMMGAFVRVSRMTS